MDNLWLELKKIGFVETKYPTTTMDFFANKYKFISYFHKPKFSKSNVLLEKRDMLIYFDHWHIDFLNNKKTLTFNKEYSIDEIFTYIRDFDIQETRELKSKRIIEDGDNEYE